MLFWTYCRWGRGRGMPVPSSVFQQAAQTWSTLALTDRRQTCLHAEHKNKHEDITFWAYRAVPPNTKQRSHSGGTHLRVSWWSRHVSGSTWSHRSRSPYPRSLSQCSARDELLVEPTEGTVRQRDAALHYSLSIMLNMVITERHWPLSVSRPGVGVRS